MTVSAVRTICFCNSNIPWGGGEKWHLEAALSFARRGWRVFVMCHPDSALLQRVKQEASLTAFPCAITRFSFLNLTTRRVVSRFLLNEGIQAVIMNLPADLKCIAPVAKEAGVRHIYYRRGSALPVSNSWLNRFVFSLLTGVIVNSQETQKLLLSKNSRLIDAAKIHLLPNGIDIPAFDAALAKARESRVLDAQGIGQAHTEEFPLVVFGQEATSSADCQYQLDKGDSKPFIIGNAGRLNKQKAQHLLLYLVKALQEKQVDCRLLIAGEGEQFSELRELAKRLGVEEQVEFLGFLPDLSAFWQSIDLFVLSSLWEGFGYVLAEAMLASKPVFAFRVSNMPELIEEGKNGRLFPLPVHGEVARQTPHMPELVDACSQFAKEPALGIQMGRRAREMAVARFSQEVQMDRLERLLSY